MQVCLRLVNVWWVSDALFALELLLPRFQSKLRYALKTWIVLYKGL